MLYHVRLLFYQIALRLPFGSELALNGGTDFKPKERQSIARAMFPWGGYCDVMHTVSRMTFKPNIELDIYGYDQYAIWLGI